MSNSYLGEENRKTHFREACAKVLRENVRQQVRAGTAGAQRVRRHARNRDGQQKSHELQLTRALSK